VKGRRGSIDWARLNHILLPEGKARRDDVRRSRIGRVLSPLIGIYGALTQEGRFLFVLTLLVGVASLDVRRSDAHALFCVLGGWVYASLAMSRAFKLEGVDLSVTAPRRVTVREPITFSLVCRSRQPRSYSGIRVRGPFLPWDGQWVSSRPTISVLEALGTARVDMQARFTQRGEHHLDPFEIAAAVPLGLTLGPRVFSAGTAFLVVPKIANVTHVTTPHGRRHQPGGIALASKTGESMDLLGVRPYRPGDPVRDLHARSWARTGTPVVREYQEEYFSRVGVIVDTDREIAGAESIEAALSLAAGVVASLSRGEALIDLLVVGEDVHSLTLGRSLGFLDQALDLLACVEPGAPVSPDALLQRLRPHLPRLSSIVFISLAWDEPRRELAERTRGFGVGCSLILVADEGSNGFARTDCKSVSPRAIESGERLAL
jgi:uncharacterized protein (DUF58 family)